VYLSACSPLRMGKGMDFTDPRRSSSGLLADGKLAGSVMSRADRLIEEWMGVAFYGGTFAYHMVRGLRDSGRRALGPGVLLLLVWVVIGGLSVVSLWFSDWLRTQLPAAATDAVDAVVGLAVLLPAFMFLTKMTFAARRRMAPDARELLARDQRPPILYLRTFDDDNEESRNPDSGGMIFGTYEERLIRAMRRYGPVVAIGRPGERLPPLGAARMYADADWKRTVSELAAKARLVVLRPAATEAVLWEATTAARVAGGDKVALYVRGLRLDAWTGFVNQLGDTLGAPLPPRPEPDAILLYLRDGAVHTVRWEQPDAVGEGGQYVPTRSLVEPLFRS
jgi:hypothetical protein